ncbi:DUF4142 domain-containing protein [Caenimonas sp. SL110]|uniref:DUF4142 domain-containing protein n=1 Tax=Caenimonas sp. SL110 TaxID=1450524 RepID=UPI000652C757|nr:DUF4142 domain-containing protein [Caenimonas sp. SL110]
MIKLSTSFAAPALVALVALASGTAWAAGLAKPDQEFLEKAAIGNLFEIEAGKMALARGKKEDVKLLGEQSVKDHTKNAQELAQLAAAKGVKLPTELPADRKKKLEAWAASKNFDGLYLSALGYNSHSQDMALFEKASKEAKDKDVRAYAAKTLPVLKMHNRAAHGSLTNKS